MQIYFVQGAYQSHMTSDAFKYHTYIFITWKPELPLSSNSFMAFFNTAAQLLW